MKKTLLFTFLLFSFLYYAQTATVGRYEVYFEGWLKGASNHHCGEANVEMTLTKNGSNTVLNVFKATYGENSATEYFARTTESGKTGTLKYFKADESITRLRFTASRRIRQSCSGPRPHNGGSIYTNLNKSCYVLPFEFMDFMDKDETDDAGSTDGGLWNSSFKMFIKPELVILNENPSANFIATNDKTRIVSHTGFRPDEYKWQYSIDGVNYINLPQYDGLSSIDVNAQDILGGSVDASIGNFIQIRQTSGCDSYSNIVQYKVLKSSPKITSHGPAIKVTCYDGDDGQYRLFFDRPLDATANEYISINVVNTVTLQPSKVDYTNITQLEADNSYNLTGLLPGSYQVKIIGKYNGMDTYSETTAQPILFTIDRNPPVDFSISSTNIWCYQGSDGTILITAKGGTGGGFAYQLNGGEWVPFSNANSTTHTIKGLKEGTYTLKVRDGNSCVAKIQTPNSDGEIALGAEKQQSTTLTAPKEPLRIEYTLLQEPTFTGATNGKIVAKVDGGTIFDTNTYWYEWKNEQGQILSPSTHYVSGSFYLTLDQIPAGIYSLTIRDKNFTNAEDNKNCTIIASEIELTEPEPLTAVIELLKPISCHVDNEFGNELNENPKDGQRDESQDGALRVIASGGRPFTGSQNGGKPYKYTWKKQNAAGNWITLPNTEDTLLQLSDGNYAVNVEDSKGIIIGTYQNNILVEAKDVTYYLKQPEKLVLTFESRPATCAGSDGFAKAIVTGGTAPYQYSWTNGAATSEVSGLPAMSYLVTITDARGCFTQGTVVITQPEKLVIDEKIRPLLCYNATNASIDVLVSGGTAPYSYLWNTGATTNSLQNLGAGTYTVTIKDGQGCTYLRTYTIENPEELKIDLGEDRTLCIGQQLELDATLLTEPNATYSWTSSTGFHATSAKVILKDEGTYTVTVTTPNGCVVTDMIRISRSNVAIDSEFLLTTRAYVGEYVVLVNVSNPKGITTKWIVDDPSIVIADESADYVTLRFPKEGTYRIHLKQTQGDCYMIYSKDIIVEKNDGQYNPVNTNAGFVKEFTIAPNPNNGNFTVVIKLEESSPVKLRLYTMAGQLAQPEKSLPTSKVHQVNYSLQISSGTYVLVLETPYQVLTKKLIIY